MNTAKAALWYLSCKNAQSLLEARITFDYDVTIVGGGPAGLSAALVLARACRSVMLFDAAHPRNAVARQIHGFLSRDGISPSELRRIARENLRSYRTVQLEHAEVTAARCLAPGFEVTLANGRTCRSRKLLIATGVADNVPELPGLRALYGTSVFHCPFCDAWELRGQPMAVYGRGARAHGLCLELLGWT
jgi:thioredoxin reductase